MGILYFCCHSLREDNQTGNVETGILTKTKLEALEIKSDVKELRRMKRLKE
jgi:hypothetical protein